MNKSEAEARIKKLKEAIDRNRYAYHVLNEPIVSDEVGDSLKKELFDLEMKFPDLVTPDSPTQRVAGKPLDQFQKVTHRDADGQVSRMSSLNDAFSEEDLRAWYIRLENYLNAEIAPSFYCDLKMDGLAIELVYEHGRLVQASTRGDGLVGEDVTQNIRTIEAIPLKLRDSLSDRVVIRGEVFLTKKEFVRLNREQEQIGGKIYANPRNVAAGSVRQLDPEITRARKLRFFAYSLLGDSVQTKQEEYQRIRDMGIPINPASSAVTGLEGVLEFHENAIRQRGKLDYEIDGIVVTLDDSAMFRRAGIVGKAPRGAVAYKFSPRSATTVVTGIQVQIGRTGVLTPVATMNPVNVGGVTITHASLHNADEIERLGVRIGDTVVVSRAGDVIPQITKVLPELRGGREQEFKMPKFCPIDGSKVVRDGVAYRCSSVKCGARNLESLRHFVSRSGFNIEGLGPKIITRFLDEGLISSAADIFSLEKGDIAALPRFGEKSAENIIAEISEKKKIALHRFIYSLGIIHVGEETARALAAFAASKKNIRIPADLLGIFSKATKDDLQDISDIGPKVADSIADWFKDERNISLLNDLDERGIKLVQPESPEQAGGRSLLSGKTFVITGTLASMSREEAKEKIRALGGKVLSSISKNTDYLLAGAEPGSKYTKAEKLNVPILDEKSFQKMID